MTLLRAADGSHSGRLRLAGSGYFTLQALAGAAWWILVFTCAPIRSLTLGDLNPTLMAALDLPLFVLASGIAGLGGVVHIRARHPLSGTTPAAARDRLPGWTLAAVWLAVLWTLTITLFMVGYATVTRLAGWGAVLMLLASACSLIAGVVLVTGEFPGRFLLLGPLAIREARPHRTTAHVAATLTQMLLFWGCFLFALPLAIAWFERRWRIAAEAPAWLAGCGLAVLILASALGIWSALSMSTRGRGTPLPSATATRLVVAGPYRWVRNPMAVAGIAQAAAVGLLMGSWLVVGYAIIGSLIWNWLVRPLEEADLAARFGAEYAAYRERVSCWIPRRRHPRS